MKVKIGTKVYDSNNEAIMIILDEEEKEMIGNMSKNSTKFCSYPEDMPVHEVLEFMELNEEV